jgi:uncharacterized protein HemX
MSLTTYKRLFWALVVALSIAVGQWTYVRLRAAEQAYAFLASAPEGAKQPRAQLIDTLLKQQPVSPAK